jgi:hypothetical protein
MSKDFFEIMERIEKAAKDIKFLENTHPEIYNEFIGSANEVLNVVCKLEGELKSNLKNRYSKPIKTKKAKNGRLKS